MSNKAQSQPIKMPINPASGVCPTTLRAWQMMLGFTVDTKNRLSVTT